MPKRSVDDRYDTREELDQAYGGHMVDEDTKLTKTPNIFLLVKSGKYAFADETWGLNGDYDTEEKAKEALDQYCRRYL